MSPSRARRPTAAGAVAALLGAAAAAAGSGGCAHVHHFSAGALADALELREAEARLAGPALIGPGAETEPGAAAPRGPDGGATPSSAAPAAAAPAAGPLRGLTVRERDHGKLVKVPPHGPLWLVTGAGAAPVAPAELALSDGAFVAGATRVARAELREATYRTPFSVPAALGLIGLGVVFFGVAAFAVWVQRL
jgi:hypothetical protein